MLVTPRESGGNRNVNGNNPVRVELLFIPSYIILFAVPGMKSKVVFRRKTFNSTRFGLLFSNLSITPNKNWGSFIFIHLRWNYSAKSSLARSSAFH